MSEALVRAVDELISYVKACCEVREVDGSFGEDLILHDDDDEIQRLEELDDAVFREARKASLLDARPHPLTVERPYNVTPLPPLQFWGWTNLPFDDDEKGIIVYWDKGWIREMESLRRLAAGEPTKNQPITKGVSLLDAALILDGEAKLARQTVRRWQKSRSPTLPVEIGCCTSHGQRKLYELAPLLEFILLAGDPVTELEKSLRHKLREPRIEQPQTGRKPAAPAAKLKRRKSRTPRKW